MNRKLITVGIAFLLIMMVPMAHAENITMSGTVRFERQNMTANTSIPLNLSDPQQLKEYSPVYNFWPSENNGIIIDSTLPPDILKEDNLTELTLNGTFRITSQDAADGASLFQLRLPFSTNLGNITYINLGIYHNTRKILDYEISLDLLRSYHEPYSKYNISYYNNTYLDCNLTFIYLLLRTLILSGVTYNYSLDVDMTGTAYVFVAGFDLFNDNITGFEINKKRYNGDLMTGFRILDMVSNGFGEFEQVYMQKEYRLDSTYSGTQYVSFNIGLISRAQPQNITARVTTLDSNGLMYDANSTYIAINSTGPVMIYGHVQVNFSGTNTILITLYSNVSGGLSVITDGEDTTPIQPDASLLTKSLVEVQKTYLSWYMDVIVTGSKYYYPFFIRLPGTWQENVEIVMKKIGCAAFIPVVMAGLYTGLAAATVENFTLNLMFTPFIIAGQALKALLNAVYAGFEWFMDTVVKFILSGVEYWLWVTEILVGVVVNVFFWLIAAVLGNSMVNAMVRLPKDGINAVFEEFGKGLSTVNQILAPVKKAVGKVSGAIAGVMGE